MTHDEPAKALFNMPMDSQVTIVAALLSDQVIWERLAQTEWFRRWAMQNPNLMVTALAAAHSIRRHGFDKVKP